MIRVLQMGMTDNLGGIENYLINYYKHIDKSKVQFDFTNIYSNNLCFSEEITNMGGKIYNVHNYYKHPIKYIVDVVNLIKCNKYKIVHCNMNSAVMLFPLIAAKIAKVPVIIAHSHNASSDKGFIKSLLHNINKIFIPLFANKFFACSKLAGKWFFSNRIINSNDFFIINNAIDIEHFSFVKELRENKRKELNIDDNTFVIGHVGRFNKQKNQIYLIDIFKLFLEKNPNSILLLVGIGPELEKVQEKVDSLNLSDKVLFLKQRNDVNVLMMAFDSFVLPSLYEGLPLVGIEAQVSGLTCLFSSKITDEVLLLDTSRLLDINKDNLDEWCKNLANISKKKNRDVSDSIYSYDINMNSDKLCNYYAKFLNK